MMHKSVIQHDFEGHSVSLTDPTVMPVASGFLWNAKMMLQMNCRGFATSQFMQPEPARYSNGPVNEAPGFMQPEPQYFAHHPGRFFYVRENEQSFSLPYEPMRKRPDAYKFTQQQDAIVWHIRNEGLVYTLTLRLPVDDTVELWTLEVHNTTPHTRSLDLYPHFSIGYMSWMNQSADFDEALNAVVAQKVTPYQKVTDYFVQKDFKDTTFLLADAQAQSWTTSQRAFEGEGGLHDPDGLKSPSLGNESALYETPVAVMRQQLVLEAGQRVTQKYVFGAVQNKEQIADLKARFIDDSTGFSRAASEYRQYLESAKGCMQIKTDDAVFDQYVNHWLPRQVFYHGDVNRLSTDPQTRNYLQDHMGMIYLDPADFSSALLLALGQQHESGEMPDGILLHPDAKLKYINQVPHSDHSVWVALCLHAYLNETGDIGLIEKKAGFKDAKSSATVFQHVELAMKWLLSHLDERNLSLIDQGDWCDPMNMVGYKGKGVSAWLSMATTWAFDCWSEICSWRGETEIATKWKLHADVIRKAVNTLLWDGNWYARGITDNGRMFGISEDREGRIYLNPQSWAMLSNTADDVQQSLMISQVQRQLVTPYGAMMLAPAYTKMDTDIGRLTQKFSGVAENGSVYNHAAAFYAYALLVKDKAEEAYELIRAMMISSDNTEACGQLPVFVPNYFRGAYYQHPSTAGRSSQLFNTGTVAWLYRMIVEQMFGVRGEKGVLVFEPTLPAHIREARVQRRFRGADFDISIKKVHGSVGQIWLEGSLLSEFRVDNIVAGKSYRVELELPGED